MKLDKKEAESINFESLDQGLVIQETRAFAETPLKMKKCELVLMKLLYLMHNGTKFNEDDATIIFFAVTKTFQSKEPHLRRLTYLVIRELAKTAQDVLMATSSLTQDLVSKSDYFFKTGSIRALGAIVDTSMLVSLERFFKQAFMDNDRLVAVAALSTVYHFAAENPETVKRWSTEISQYIGSGSSKSLCQYLALGILFLTRQSDRIAMMKIFQQVPMNASGPTLLLYLRIYAQMIQFKPPISGFNVIDLKPYLKIRSKNDMVAIEAARVICELHWLYERDLSVAVNTLQGFLSSGNSVIRFSAMKVLNQLASKNPKAVSGCNIEIEQLLTDSNRTVATLAVTTLLKTGTESSIDRLIKQMSSFVSEISDEYKTIVVDAVKTLCLKFPGKYSIMIEFLGSILREEGGYDYKKNNVDAICEILNNIPESREIGLAQLCEFIEDCEYPKLTAKIIYLIGDIGPESKKATEMIRYIYNRLILENTIVRVACVGAFAKFAMKVDSSRKDIVGILKNKCCNDSDDEVRDRALVSLSLISSQRPTDELFTYYDPVALEATLLESKENCDFSNVPKISKLAFLKSLESKRPTNEPLKAIEVEEPKVILETKITQIPGFNSLGPIIHSSASKILNDLDAECNLSIITHIFRSFMVLEFVCNNTINSIAIENVVINPAISSDMQVQVERFFPVKSLKYGAPESAFLVLSCDPLQRPTISVECSVSFAFRDFDESLNTCTGPPSMENFKLAAFEVGFSDYVQPLKVASFESVWKSEKNVAGNEATFELPHLSSIQESVDLLVDLFGGRVFDQSDRILPSATVHTLSVGGLLVDRRGSVPFLVRCRMALVRQCVTLELKIKSPDQSIADAVLALVQ